MIFITHICKCCDSPMIKWESTKNQDSLYQQCSNVILFVHLNDTQEQYNFTEFLSTDIGTTACLYSLYQELLSHFYNT